MKIVLIGPAHPLRGGIAQFLALLYQAFRKAGHDVVFHRFIRQYPKFLFPGKTQEDESSSPVDVQSTPVLDPLNPLNWPVAAWRIARGKPDLIVLKWWMPFFGISYTVTLWLVKRLCDAKVMYIVDNAIPHEKRPGDMLITRAGFAVADCFIVMSEAVRDDLISIKPRANFILTPHPLYEVFGMATDKDRAKEALGLSGPVILFFGFVRAYKGLNVLIDAMPLMLKELKLTLLIAGEFYEDKEPYVRQIERAGIGGHVRVLDQYIPNEAVGGYFSASDLLVLPYLSATQSGITQIAYAFDVPVVATRVGGLPEVVEDGVSGYLVPPDDPACLASAVVRFFREGKAEEFRAGIGRIKGRYSWEAMVGAIERLAGKGKA